MDFATWYAMSLSIWLTSDKSQRLGQFLYNNMPVEYAYLIERSGREQVDPFYDDKNIPSFLMMLAENWEK